VRDRVHALAPGEEAQGVSMLAMGSITFRHVGPDGWREWRRLRLSALAEAADAFESRLSDWQDQPEGRWRDRLASVPLNLVADLDGSSVGMVSGAHLDAPGAVELLSLWVAPEARGKGIANGLIGAVIDWAVDQGAGQLRLAVRAANAPAVALYRRNGFEHAGPRRGRPGSPPECEMVLDLTAPPAPGAGWEQPQGQR